MPRTREFLSSGERSLLSKPEELQKMSPQKRGTLFRDVRLKAVCMIEALTFLSKHLPEKQLAKILTPENEALQLLVNQVLEAGQDPRLRTERHYRLARLFAEKSLRMLEDRIPYGRDNDYLSDTMLKDLVRTRELIRLVVRDSEPKKK